MQRSRSRWTLPLCGLWLLLAAPAAAPSQAAAGAERVVPSAPAGLGSAVQTTSADSGPAAQATSAVSGSALQATTADSGRVAVPPATPRAERYHRSGLLLGWVGIAWGIALPLALLFSGLSARLRDLAWRLGRRWYPALVVYGAMVSILFWLASLPLTWYLGFAREHAYGLSTQSGAQWWGDSAKGMLLGVLGFALVMWIPYLLLKQSPRRWWLWSSLAAVPVLVLTYWITPLAVDPLFDRFGPMRDHALESRILAQAARAGIEGSRVFEVNKSQDTRALNAYVTGFGGSRRIVLWDTTVDRLSEPELLFVVGHEMGHYVLHHVQLLIAVSALLLLLFLFAAHLSAGWLIARYRTRFGFERLDDFASYPLLAVIVGVVSLAILPPYLALSRHLEHEADRFGLELTRDNRAAATAFIKLQSDNLAVPWHGKLDTFWHDSHPPLGERIEFANHYRPWQRGEPLRYDGRFH